LTQEEVKIKKKTKKYKWLRRIARVLLSLLILSILLLLFIRSPWGQSIIINQAVSYVKDKTGTEVQLESAFITFDGHIKVDGLYLGDLKNDTLLYSRSLEANIPLLPLIKGTGFEIDDVSWDGLTARVKRTDTIDGFNYQFLVDAFSTAPDTTASEPMNFKIGTIQLTNFDIMYQDEVGKMDAIAKFDELLVEMNELDLDKMLIDLETLTLRNAVINYEKDMVTAFAKATAASNPHKDTSLTKEWPLPLLIAHKIRLDSVKINYNSEPDGIVIRTDFGVLETSIPKADIQNSDILVSYLNLNDSNMEVMMDDVASSASDELIIYEWPDMKIGLEKLTLKNNRFLYALNGAQPHASQFQSDAVLLTGIHVELHDFKLADKNAAVVIDSASVYVNAGLRLHQLKGKLKASDTDLNISNLVTSVNKSSLKGNISLGYTSINALINNPEALQLDIALPFYSFDLKEMYTFQPDLATNEYFSKLAQKPLKGKITARGSSENLRLEKFEVTWGASTSITANGTLQHITNVEQLYFNLPELIATTNRNSILAFIKEEDLGITLPETAQLISSVSGTLNRVRTKSSLQTSYGSLMLDGSFSNSDQLKYDAQLQVNELQLSKMLRMQGIGRLSLQLKTQGSGSDLSSLDASINGKILEFAYNDYPLKNIPLQGSIKNGDGSFSSKFKDDNINIALYAAVQLEKESVKSQATIDITGADLKAFSMSSKNLKAAGKIDVNYEGDAAGYKINTKVADGIAVFDEQSYLLGTLNVDVFVKPDSTSLDLKNKMLDLQLRSNSDPQNIGKALKRHINKYLTNSIKTDSLSPVVLQITGKITPAPILRDVILPELQALDPVIFRMDFNEKDRRLDSDIAVPYLKYADSEVDSLFISSESDTQNLTFQLGFNKIEAGPITIKRTALTGIVSENKLNLDFTSYDEEERLLHFASTLSRKRDSNGIEDLIFNLSLNDLILNKKPWIIPESNEIAIRENRIAFKDFKLTNGAQSIELRSDRPTTDKDHIALLLRNFRLQALLSFLNPDEKLASGEVNGELILEDIYGTTGFLADLEIVDLHALEIPLGRLKINAKTEDGSIYNTAISVKGDAVDVVLAGYYKTDEMAADLDFDLDVNRINMSTITGFSSDFLKEGTGSINGAFKIAGTTANPKYKGVLRFDKAAASVSMLNTSFTFKDEEIKVDNSGITMNKLHIADAQGDIFTVDGKIGTDNLLVPTFDLKLTAKDFTAINSTNKDNELYYGQATFDAKAAITGNLDVPVVDIDLTVKEVTDITYVVPATELDVVQRDGIVQFVNKQNPEAILTQTEEETATLTGFDITVNFKIKDDAKVTIIIEPTTRDQLQVSGTGDLKFRMTPNGRMTLAGRYEIADGYYQLNLYDIVSRRFELAKGGSVTWSGDPFDANLDVSAIYKVETSASALMASQTSGADITDKNRFRQVLPFLVYLNVDGELLQPEISFQINLPEEEQGAIGGQVNGRLQQLNTQNQELNKQVFSLLVLNKFFPTSGSDGTNGGTATIARDNLNQALSDQLNQFGGKLLGNSGIDLNFGLDSYTDYQSGDGQQRTQLDATASKKLMDDRLIVSVGSEVAIQGSPQNGEQAPAIGNVSIEYLLTEAGQWRLKGFRRNQYDNVVDGQLIVSGIALVFSKEFNEFKNLFKKTVVAEEKKARREEDEKEKLKKEAAEK
jgi:hypothetical protein